MKVPPVASSLKNIEDRIEKRMPIRAAKLKGARPLVGGGGDYLAGFGWALDVGALYVRHWMSELTPA